MARQLIITGAIIPGVGIGFNLLFPPEHYAYFGELTLLLLFALVALLRYRVSPGSALFLWCAGVQLPLLADVERAYSVNNTWSVFILGPFVGLLIVGLALKDRTATKSFVGVALVANCAVGIICKDIGQAGALCALTFISGLLLVAQCDTEAQK